MLPNSKLILLLAAVSVLSACSADDRAAITVLDSESVDTASSPLAVRCGREGGPCCANNTCRGDLNCNFNVQICTRACGGVDEACCGVAQTCDEGLFCNFDHCADSCGEAGQECCRPENRCFDGSTCDVSTGLCE